MAGPYGSPASHVFHKYPNNQSLVPNQGLDSVDPDSILSLLLLQLWSGNQNGRLTQRSCGRNAVPARSPFSPAC